MKLNKELLIIPLIVFLGWFAMKWYKTPSQGVGVVAPDFTAYMASGDSVTLSQLKGKYVLLEFWGSWCGPCRVNNKSLTLLYNKFSDVEFSDAKGFELISIGIETNINAWQKAIINDNLIWPYHVSDIKRFKDHVAILYGVREIPASILINPEGIIIAVNLPNEKIDEILTRKLR